MSDVVGDTPFLNFRRLRRWWYRDGVNGLQDAGS